MGTATLEEQASITAPSAAKWSIAPRSDTYLYYKGTAGTEYQIAKFAGAVADINANPTWIKVGSALAYTSFQTAATSLSVTLFSLVAGGIISGIKIKHSTAFAGAAISAVTMEVGTVGTTDLYAPAFDVLQATGAGVFSLSGVLGSESHTAATNILVTARSTGANLSALSAGVVDIWALLSKAT